jgi:hypothetical protein
VGPALTADNSAVIFVPNVEVRKEAQHSCSPPPPLSLHNLLQESFTFYNIYEHMLRQYFRVTVGMTDVRGTRMLPVTEGQEIPNM